MEYSHERAVADGVNVGYDVYRIQTEITEKGSKVDAGFFIDKRNKLTRKTRWEQLDEELEYAYLWKNLLRPCSFLGNFGLDSVNVITDIHTSATARSWLYSMTRFWSKNPGLFRRGRSQPYDKGIEVFEHLSPQVVY